MSDNSQRYDWYATSDAEKLWESGDDKLFDRVCQQFGVPAKLIGDISQPRFTEDRDAPFPPNHVDDELPLPS